MQTVSTKVETVFFMRYRLQVLSFALRLINFSRMKKLGLIWMLLLAGIGLQAQQKGKPLNVIFILADDMGYADLSCYGNPLIKTPHLDRLAKEGLKANSFMVPAPTCSPSRAALLTGRYPNRVGIPYAIGPGNPNGLQDSIFTMAKMFKKANYATMMIGKWHLGDHAHTKPNDHGFDHFLGMLYSHDYQDPFVKTDTTLAVFYDTQRVWEKPDWTKLMDLYTDSATAYIKRASKSEQPFFLYLPFNMPHAPVATPAKWKGHSEGGVYGDVIEQLDDCVGRIYSLIHQLKIDQQTLIVFTSDNGPWNNMPQRMFGRDIVKPWDHGSVGPFRGGKADTYEGGHRVPFIAWNPKSIPAQLATAPFNINDMLPTIAAAIRYKQPLPSNLDGENLWPNFTKKVPFKKDRALFYLNHLTKLEAVRKGEWKLRVAQETKPQVVELYNLDVDIAEKYNVAAQYPAIVKELQALMEQYGQK